MCHLLFKKLQLNTLSTSYWILKSVKGFRNVPHPEKIIFLLHKCSKIGLCSAVPKKYMMVRWSHLYGLICLHLRIPNMYGTSKSVNRFRNAPRKTKNLLHKNRPNPTPGHKVMAQVLTGNFY